MYTQWLTKACSFCCCNLHSVPSIENCDYLNTNKCPQLLEQLGVVGHFTHASIGILTCTLKRSFSEMKMCKRQNVFWHLSLLLPDLLFMTKLVLIAGIGNLARHLKISNCILFKFFLIVKIRQCIFNGNDVTSMTCKSISTHGITMKCK